MVVAITTFDSVISPLFDMSRRVDLYRLDGGHARRVGQLLVGDCPARGRIQLLVNNDVQTLICGAISRFCQQSLLRAGIQVFPWTSGDSDAVLALLAKRMGGADGRARQDRAPRYPAVIPAMGPNINAAVAKDPGSCRYLIMLPDQEHAPLVHNLPTREWTSDSLQRVQAMVGIGTRALLTHRCSPALLGLLAVAGIDVFLGLSGSAGAVARRYALAETTRAGAVCGLQRGDVQENHS